MRRCGMGHAFLLARDKITPKDQTYLVVVFILPGMVL